MKRYLWFAILLGLVLLYAGCGEDKKTITGTTEIEEIQASVPAILADGLSTATIVAVVSDSSGAVRNQRVEFSTTHGTITEAAFTNAMGEATAIITSSASEVDLNVTITAALASSGNLSKTALKSRRVTLRFADADKNTKLEKGRTAEENTATIGMVFLGVNLSYKLGNSELPADGISTTKLEFTIRETTSKRAVNNARIYLRAAQNSLPNELITDDRGMASTLITSLTRALIDTIYIDYGDRMSFTTTLTYIKPMLYLTPETAEVIADGFSKLSMQARLVSHKNNPIAGAEIHFSTTSGVITGSSITDDAGLALAELVSTKSVDPNVIVVARFNDITDTSRVVFIEGVEGEKKIYLEGEQEFIRDGMTKHPITATLMDAQYRVLGFHEIHFSATYGRIDTVAVTNEEGKAVVQYTPASGESDVTDVIVARIDSVETRMSVSLLGVSLEVSADPTSVPADGFSPSTITAVVKLATTRIAVPGAYVTFSTDLGWIQHSAITDELGMADASLVSDIPGTAEVQVRFGTILRTVQVEFTPELPNSIVLDAEPNFIWVKETGNLEQTMITATVLNQVGKPISSTVTVIFNLRNGPDGGEFLEPSVSGDVTMSTPIRTVSGRASVKLRSGIRSGTCEIRAEVDGYDEVAARTTNVVIRSGPPYIYIDPSDKSVFESHMSMAADYLNLPGWNIMIKDFNLSLYVGDKYNNPVEEGTTIYLRTSGGIATTDVLTDSLGVGSAKLWTANPLPRLESDDPNAMVPHEIPNPNDPASMLPIVVPDFDGDGAENNGIAYVLATTHGRDQNGEDAVAFYVGRLVFSGPVAVFDVTADDYSLRIGQAATITVRLYDVNGNPVAAGSSLKVETSAGALSAEQLMATAENYGYGHTTFQVQLVNTLDAQAESPATALVRFILESPNGSMARGISIQLLNQ